jgi:hypothetical protein
LAKFQDALGWSNDKAIAARLLKDLPDIEMQFTDSIRQVQIYLTSGADNKERKMTSIWKKITPSKILF